MAFDPLAFSRGLLEGAVEVKQAEAERREKIQEQIRKAQLKAVETQMESYNKRRSTYNSIQSARKSGDYNTAMLYAIKDSGLDYDDIGKVVDTSDPEKVKAYLNSWEKEFMAIPEPNYEQAVEDSYKYTEKERGIVSTTLRSWLGIEPDEVMYSAAKSHRPPPFQGSVEDDRPTGPIPLKDKETTSKPSIGREVITDPKTGEQYIGATSLSTDAQGRIIVHDFRTIGKKGPPKELPAVNEQNQTAIYNRMQDRIKELQNQGQDDLADLLRVGIGDNKRGFGGLQDSWKELADNYRRSSDVSDLEAYQMAANDLIELYKAGIIIPQNTWAGPFKDKEYDIPTDYATITDRFNKAIREGKITKEEAKALAIKYGFFK